MYGLWFIRYSNGKMECRSGTKQEVFEYAMKKTEGTKLGFVIN